jgi:hypothetical protein
MTHKKSKRTSNHSLVPIVQLQSEDFVLPSKCRMHEEQADGFCQKCFSLVCPICLYDGHSPASHQLSSIKDAKPEEEKNILQILIDESIKTVDLLKSSLLEINQMHQNAESRYENLINSVDKVFFSIFEKLLPEIKESLFHQLRRNSEILENQKERVQNLLLILEKELSKSKKNIQGNSVLEIITMKTNLFDSLSEISQTFLVPQRTDNVNLSCGDYTFNQPDSPFNSADEKVIVSSIVDSFHKLFHIQLSIPILEKLENEIQTKPNLETERATREQEETEINEQYK